MKTLCTVSSYFIFKMYLFSIQGYLLYIIVLVSVTYQHTYVCPLPLEPPSVSCFKCKMMTEKKSTEGKKS